MAYVNVAEWSPDQVTEWLKGLDNVITPYINSFLNNEVKGQQLLNLRSDDLEHLGVYTLGHQELILEAVEHLRNFHYELDRENLQLLALRLSCAANSLYNELSPLEDNNVVETQTMADVANIISTIKPLVCWLDRSPFSGQTEYSDRKSSLLQLSLEMVTCALRDRFAERPVGEIKDTCCALAQLADKIIQDISDPMLLQPASLDLATLKKRENELGFFILPSFHAVHQIAEIKFGSPAHTSGKIEEGDEIVQVNYQTVVGWQRKKVLSLFQESPPDVLLTLKKRPRHTKIYGQIYMKPYRLPSKKRALPYTRWHDNLPSPRPELLTIPDFEMPLPKVPAGAPPPLLPACSSDSDSCSSVSDSDGGPQQGLCPRVYPLKPRPVLQRRNTITGASPTSKGPSVSIEQFWRELKTQAFYKHSSSSFIQPTKEDTNLESLLRDKSASYGHGLELNPRPSTVIGLAQGAKNSHKKGQSNSRLKHLKGIEDTSQNEGSAEKSISEQKSKKKIGVRFQDEVSQSKEDSENTSPKASCSYQISTLDNALHVKNEESLKFIDDNEDEVQDRSNLTSEPKKDSIDTDNFQIDVKQKVSSFENKISNTKTDRNVDLKEILQTSNHCKPIPKTRTIYKSPEPDGNLEKLPKEPGKLRKPPEIPPKPHILKKPAIPPRNFDRIIQLRGRLDKSHSTPAYDTSESVDTEVLISSERIPKFAKTLGPDLIPMDEIITDIKLDNILVETVECPENRQVNGPTLAQEENVEMTDSMEDRIITEKMGVILETINTSLLQHRQKEQDALCLNEKIAEAVAIEVISPKILDPYEAFVPIYQKATTVNIIEKQLNNAQDVACKDIEIYKNRLPDVLKVEKKHFDSQDEAPVPPPRPSHTLNIESPKNKFFQPSNVSTPKLDKSNFDYDNSLANNTLIVINQDSSKLSPKLKVSEEPKSKIPAHDFSRSKPDKCEVKVTTNPVVKAIISKGKTVKKKNSLLAKRRKVCVKDVSPGEIQGHLYQRIRNKNTQNVNWTKRWFVLNGSALYGFKTKDGAKADCVIFLPGFTVSLATEVKSRSHAFKVYHTGTAFYFAADNIETMSTWVDLITLATLESTSKSMNESNMCSETDDSDDEEKLIKSPEKNHEPSRKFGSLKKFTSRKNSDASTSTESSGSTSLDRKYLRFFNTHSGAKTPKNQNLPVPTAQFRSYRKVVPPSLVVNQHVSPQSTNIVSNLLKHKDTSESIVQIVEPPATIDDVPPKLAPKPMKLAPKPKPIHYIHASNPSLCDFNDFKVPTFVPKPKILHRNDNLAGFITLKQFMLNRQEEEKKQNIFSARQNELIDSEEKTQTIAPPQKTHSRKHSDAKSDKSSSSRKNSVDHGEHKKLSVSHSYSCRPSESQTDKNALCRKYSDGMADRITEPRTRLFSQDSLLEIQSRILPKTPDCDNNVSGYHTDLRKMSVDSVFDHRIHDAFYDQYAIDMAQNIYGEPSYEMIGAANSSKTLGNLKKPHPPTPKHKNKIVRQHSLNSADKKFDKQAVFNRGDSPEKFWIDSLRRNDKVFSSSSSYKDKTKLKSATQYTPMSVSFSDKLNPKFAFELNLDEKASKTSKFKNFFSGGHKSEAEKHKEKTLLGSPRLHRAIFRRNHSPTTETDWRGEFSQATASLSHLSHPVSVNHACALPPPTLTQMHPQPQPNMPVPPPDYPGLEYPPVFEPETYSLTNPACSLLRKTTNKNLNNK